MDLCQTISKSKSNYAGHQHAPASSSPGGGSASATFRCSDAAPSSSFAGGASSGSKISDLEPEKAEQTMVRRLRWGRARDSLGRAGSTKDISKK